MRSAIGERFPPLIAESNELRNLDLLRLIAAYGIVVHHFRTYIPAEMQTVAQLHWWFLPMFVDLFFAISGFIICYVYFDRMDTPGQYGMFLRRRFARLVPLHWATLLVFSLIGIGIIFGLKVAEPDKYDWGCFLPNLLMVHSLNICDRLTFNYASWSISAEMLLYVAFPVLCLLLRMHRLAPLIVAGVVIAALASLAPAGEQGERFWVGWTHHWGFARAVPSFLVGMSLFAVRDGLKKIPHAGLLSWVALLAFVALGLAGLRPFTLLPLVYLIVALTIAADMQGRVGALAARISVGGQLTYSIYMLHPLIAVILLGLVGQKLLHLAGVAAIAWMIIAAGLLLGASYLSFVFFETPMRRWLSGGRAATVAPVTNPVPQSSGS
jgi:peptidoglycan/LPS O-acetylase OafA/YrhL